MKSNMVRRATHRRSRSGAGRNGGRRCECHRLDPGEQRQGSLASFGPLMDNGFPTSYKDSHARPARGVHHRRRPAVRGSGRPTPTTPTSRCPSRPTSPTSSSTSSPAPRCRCPATADLLVETNLEGAFLGNGAPARRPDRLRAGPDQGKSTSRTAPPGGSPTRTAWT